MEIKTQPKTDDERRLDTLCRAMHWKWSVWGADPPPSLVARIDCGMTQIASGTGLSREGAVRQLLKVLEMAWPRQAELATDDDPPPPESDRVAAGPGAIIIKAPLSQLERDLGLIGRWLKDGDDARKVSLERLDDGKEFQALYGRHSKIVPDAASFGASVEVAIHGAARKLYKDVIRERNSHHQRSIDAAGVLGDWTEDTPDA